LKMSFRRSKPTSPETCPGIRDFIRPTLAYTKCISCGGDVEIWSDEDTGVCLKCGKEWPRPDSNASCLDYCDYADKCREIIKARTSK
jgi:hypothetical protein